MVRYIRKQSAAEQKLKMTPPTNDQPDKIASPVTRASGNPSVPMEYTELDYVEQEKDLRNAPHGPWVDRATVLPKDEGPLRRWATRTPYWYAMSPCSTKRDA